MRSTRADGKSVNSSSFNVAVGRLRIGAYVCDERWKDGGWWKDDCRTACSYLFWVFCWLSPEMDWTDAEKRQCQCNRYAAACDVDPLDSGFSYSLPWCKLIELWNVVKPFWVDRSVWWKSSSEEGAMRYAVLMIYSFLAVQSSPCVPSCRCLVSNQISDPPGLSDVSCGFVPCAWPEAHIS